MSKTFLDVTTDIRTYLDESSQADWLDSEVARAANFAYQQVATKVMQVYEKYYETTTPFYYAVVGGQQEYLIDPSLIKVTRVEINFAAGTQGSNPMKATAISMDEDLINISNTSTITFYGNVGYYIHGNQPTQKIGFVPIPPTSDPVGTKSISVWGIATPTDLVSSTDQVIIPYADAYTYLISLRAAGFLLSKGQQSETAGSKYLSIYKAEVTEMMNFLRDRQEDGAKTVQDTTLQNTDFGFPL